MVGLVMGFVMISIIIKNVSLMVEIAVDPMSTLNTAQNAYV